MAHIFFSYKRDDPEFGQQIEWALKNLKSAGFDVFIDVQGIPLSANWVASIEQAIESCDVGVVLWTPAAKASDAVLAEAVRLNRAARYCGVFLGEPAACLPFIFEIFQHADLRGWNGSADHPEWTKLVDRLRLLQAAREEARKNPQGLLVETMTVGSINDHATLRSDVAFRELKDLPILVPIPVPGRFLMGADALDTDADANERPTVDVSISHPFAMGINPITFAEWNLAAASGFKGIRAKQVPPGQDGNPVVDVTWLDTQAYVAWLNFRIGSPVYRLPSEAEWEYVARAGITGTDPAASRPTTEVTRGMSAYAPNRWGVGGLIGNVWEWTADVYVETHEGAAPDGRRREKPQSNYFTVRGASYRSPMRDRRLTVRSGFERNYSADDLGFRVVRSL